jgi:hypothetical protein
MFQSAGLGTAPFKLSHVTAGHDQCQFCGTNIGHRFHLVGADGSAFFVGSDCVLKSGDAGLRRVVEREVAKRIAEQRRLRDAEKLATLKEIIAKPEIKERLVALPHPRCPTHKNMSFWTYAEWMMRFAGKTGKLDLLKRILALPPVT